MRARYDAIYRELCDRIEQNVYPYQGFLPSESELTDEFSCSHNTLRRALGLLRERGYVQPIHGKGVRVVWRKPEKATFVIGDIESFREASKRSQLETETEVMRLGQRVADDGLAEETGFEAGTELTEVERVRRVDGKALILDHSFFRTSVAPEISEDVARESIYAYLEGKLGVSIAMSKRSITVERARERDRKLLDLGDATHLAVVTSQTFDSQGILIEYTQSRHQPDHFCFRDTAVRHKV